MKHLITIEIADKDSFGAPEQDSTVIAGVLEGNFPNSTVTVLEISPWVEIQHELEDIKNGVAHIEGLLQD